ncbi:MULTISPECIES: MFS transporter [Paraburkholderia]|uniref:MFS transporter n=1 Tax=Paraburkholderia TaxID=1822464 RepID=UPI0038BB0C1C
MSDKQFKTAPVLGASVGSAIEYFDFSVYGLLAPTLGPLFFPNQSTSGAILASLAIFGSAFVIRPLGGIVLGRLGDRVGRSPVLITTILGMGLCSIIMGLLPTDAQVGPAAAWLLLVCRLIQGFFAGGEVSGATTYIAECAPIDKRGFFGAFNPAGVSVGIALAAATVGSAYALIPADDMATWGWRIPFISSICLVAVGLWLRIRLEDTAQFHQLAEHGQVAKAPLSEVLRDHRSSLVKTIGLAFGMTSTAYLGLVYFNIYLTRVNHYDRRAIFWLLALAPLVASFCMPFIGGLSDRFGRRRLLLVGFAGYFVVIPVAMTLMSQASLPLASFATLLAFAPYAMVQSVAYPSYAELFPARVRYTGVSLGVNIGSICGGATTPFICTWLVERTGVMLSPAFYIMVCCGIASFAALRLHNVRHVPASHVGAAEAIANEAISPR